MLATLPGATAPPDGFSVTNLLVLALIIAVVYPVQKLIRKTVSRRRRERWAREDAVARDRLDHQDREPPPT